MFRIKSLDFEALFSIDLYSKGLNALSQLLTQYIMVLIVIGLINIALGIYGFRFRGKYGSVHYGKNLFIGLGFIILSFWLASKADISVWFVSPYSIHKRGSGLY